MTQQNTQDTQTIQDIVARAVGEAYDAWAKQHPSLAAVIDRMALSELAAQSLRQSPEFKAAVEEFGHSSVELDLVNKVIDLVGPILMSILGA